MDEENKILYSKLNKCWFPVAEGDSVYDVIEKRKAKILYGVGTNILTIKYEDGNLIKRKLSIDLFYKRFISITQLLKIKETTDGKDWTNKFI